MAREIKPIEKTITQSTSFDGKHTLEFNEGSHRYKLDGKACVGATTFLKGGYVTSMGLISWMKSQTAEALFKALTLERLNGGYIFNESLLPIAENQKAELIKAAKSADRAVSQEAADIGTVCHTYAELYSLGKEVEAEATLDKVRGAEQFPLIKSCVDKFKEWNKTNKGQLVLAEELIASPLNLFCGKIDRLDLVDGKMRLRDYKTSKSIYLENFIQMGAYAIALQEWKNIKVEEYEIIRLGKEDGEFETMTIKKPEEIQMMKDQALRCRATFEFRKMEDDKRFAWKK